MPLAFLGGTSLRFLYAIPRYSQDLDFSRTNNRVGYDIRAYLKEIQRQFTNEGYVVEVKISDRSAVHSAQIRFPGLLHELGLPAQPNQVFMIKVEVDTNPPLGAILETSFVNRYATLQLHHHDRASLFAGKLHAILQRPYTKGRDLYDLFWYLDNPDWPLPNFDFLNNALRQTGWQREAITPLNWTSILSEQVNTLNWRQITFDVSPFLEARADLKRFTREEIIRLLQLRNIEDDPAAS